MGNYLNEAFQKLSLLEDDFDFTADRDVVDDLRSFVADDVDEIEEEPVIDVTADSEEDLSNNYIGKVILECACCHTRIYKEESEVIIDDETELANIEEECPVCGNAQGYTVIGKIESFDDEPEDDEEEEDDDEIDFSDAENDPADEEPVESLRDRLKKRRALGEAKKIEEDAELPPDDIQLREKKKVCPKCGKEPCECESLKEGAIDNNDLSSKNATAFYNYLVNNNCYVEPERYWSVREQGKCVQVEDDANRLVVVCRLDGKIKVFFRRDTDGYDNNGDAFEHKATFENYNEFVDWYKLDYQENGWTEDEGENLEYLEDDTSVIDYDESLKEDIDRTLEVDTETEAAPQTELQSEDAARLEDMEDDPVLDESLKEGIENLSMDTDDTHVEMTSTEDGGATVSVEPKVDEPADFGGEEEIVPLSDEEQDDILANEPEDDLDDFADLDFEEEPAEEPVGDELGAEEDEFAEEEPEEEEEEEELPEESLKGSDEDTLIEEFDEVAFNDLCESYLRKVYENVNTFEATRVVDNGSEFVVEGLIKYKNGKTAKSTFKFNEAHETKSGKIVMEGFNETFSRQPKSFKIKGTLENKHYVSEAMAYKYTVRNINEGKIERTKVQGRVKR